MSPSHQQLWQLGMHVYMYLVYLLSGYYINVSSVVNMQFDWSDSAVTLATLQIV